MPSRTRATALASPADRWKVRTGEQDAVLVLTAHGTGYGRGQMRGSASGALVKRAVDVIVGKEALPQTDAAAVVELRDLLAVKMPLVLEEIDGLADATGVQPDRLLALSAVSDIGGRLPGWCSLVAQPSPGGGWTLGKNLDTPAIIGPLQVVKRLESTGTGFSFVHLTTAGACWTEGGLNEKGLALVNASVVASSVDRQGLPDGIVARAVLETCETVDDAIQMLEDTAFRSFGENLMIAAADGTAVIEKLPGCQAVRRDAHVATNHPLDPRIALAAGEDPLRPNSERRLDALRACLSADGPQPPVTAMLADRNVAQTGQDGLVTTATLVIDTRGTLRATLRATGAFVDATL